MLKGSVQESEGSRSHRGGGRDWEIMVLLYTTEQLCL